LNKPKIYFIVTVEFAVKAFLLHHLKKLSKFYDLTVVTKTSDSKFLIKRGIKAKVIPLRLFRNVNLIFDLYCLIYLFYLFVKHRPAAVHSLTPKAGLLAMLASYLAFVPLRVHTFTGQVWICNKGWKRFLLKLIDIWIGRLTKFNIVDGHSQRDFLVKNKILSLKKTLVFANGSVAGIDIKKFKFNRQAFTSIRKELFIPLNSFVILYLGRLHLDKGVLDLAKAFQRIKSKKLYLVFLGPDESFLKNSIINICKYKINNVRIIDYSENVERYLVGADILCLPSYREGFSQSIIEAAAMKIPCIASNIYGIKDSVVDKKSGLLHKVKSINSIIKGINFFLKNRHKKYIYGQYAMKRAYKNFDQEIISNEWIVFYKKHI
jgi:glycosyltransferase involved in cell wall biosynthesis